MEEDLPRLADFSKCAVVGSSASLLHSAALGAQIDQATAIFRFNDAPTDGYECYVRRNGTVDAHCT